MKRPPWFIWDFIVMLLQENGRKRKESMTGISGETGSEENNNSGFLKNVRRFFQETGIACIKDVGPV
ncbi:hypothetical protein D3Z46_03030 [Bacteroides sartorii]|nr:hypothetical protein [Phocaeicola sartorii]